MGKGLQTERERSEFLKSLYFFQLADWNGWTGWAPEIVADYVYTINIQRAWSIERQKKKNTGNSSKKRIVVISPEAQCSNYYIQDAQDSKRIKPEDKDTKS